MKLVERGFDIGDKIRELRRERALTQTELADEAGVHEITISDIERKKRKASARTLRKLASALGVEVRELTADPGQSPRFPGGAENERDFEQGLDAEEKVRRARRNAERGESGPTPGDTST